MRARRWIVVTVTAAALLLILGRVLSGWYVDAQWYAALGATELWRAKAANLLLIRGGLFLLGTLFVFANLYAVRYSVQSLVLPRRVGNLEIGEEVPGRILVAVVALLSVLIAALLALPYDDWVTLELARHGALFGETDPFFNRDLAYWLHWMPLESGLHTWALIALISVTLVVIFLYALTPSLRWDGGRLQVTGHVRRHFFTLATILLLLLAWGYRLDAYSLLHHGSGPLGAFTATDYRVGIPMNLGLVLSAIVAAMLVGWAGWTGHLRAAFVTLTLMLVAALVVRQIVPPIAGRFRSADEPEQRTYREIRNGYTRRAYDVDRLTKGEEPAALPSFDVAVRGAGLWDGAALRRVLSRRPAAVASGALGWESQDGRLVAFVADQPTGPATSDGRAAWGITRVAADVSDERGAPLVRDEADAFGGRVLAPVLVHESAASYYVLADTAGHAAAPALRGLRTRVAHAWHLQNLRLLRLPADGTVRVMLHRDVRERVRALYPAFAQATQVSPLVWRDSLFWALPLYATSTWFPLSQEFHLGEAPVRYLRHAAVALVNAHTGAATAIADHDPEPVTASWMRRFPGLFTDAAALEPDLTRLLPPRVDGMLVATLAFGQVGVRGEFQPPAHLPRALVDTVFTLPSTTPWVDAATGFLRLSFPLLDPAERLRGVVTSGGGPRFLPRWHPIDSVGPHWQVIADRLQHAGDSLRASVRNIRTTAGPVRVIPTATGVIALQTTYVTRADRTPHVLFVTLLRGDEATAAPTVTGAAGMPVPVITAVPVTPEEFRARVQALYDSMRDAIRRGDWAAFGLAYDALGRLLRSPR